MRASIAYSIAGPIAYGRRRRPPVRRAGGVRSRDPEVPPVPVSRAPRLRRAAPHRHGSGIAGIRVAPGSRGARGLAARLVRRGRPGRRVRTGRLRPSLRAFRRLLSAPLSMAVRAGMAPPGASRGSSASRPSWTCSPRSTSAILHREGRSVFRRLRRVHLPRRDGGRIFPLCAWQAIDVDGDTPVDLRRSSDHPLDLHWDAFAGRAGGLDVRRVTDRSPARRTAMARRAAHRSGCGGGRRRGSDRTAGADERQPRS